jgi:hypothetical protein
MTSKQIEELVALVSDQWDLPRLRTFAKDSFEIDLDREAPGVPMRFAALKLVDILRSASPRPRDDDLLAELRREGNARIRALVDEILRPAYFPPGEAHDAVVLGQRAFIDRDDLRSNIRAFTEPDVHTTHVLLIRGGPATGKTYSRHYLDHVARVRAGATLQRLSLNGLLTPRELIEEVFALVGLDASALPPMVDDPQLARVRPLLTAFRGQIPEMDGDRFWLVIDDLNHPNVIPAMKDAAYALAQAVEEIKPQRLWLALLGYNEPVADDTLRLVAEEDARFPNPAQVAEHFRVMASQSTRPLGRKSALRMSEVLFSRYPTLDKAAMIDLTPLVEQIGAKLREGKRP